ncbi:MarR family transcriptional regulator [soil metagenome]
MAVPVKKDAATEAWQLATDLLLGERPPRMPAISAEFGMSPMALKMLHGLEPGSEQPMSALAGAVGCDASNITGITDRLEGRGLIERRDAPADRRVKLVALTEEGERLRATMLERLYRPPDAIARLSAADQRTLRDVLRRAVAFE